MVRETYVGGPNGSRAPCSHATFSRRTDPQAVTCQECGAMGDEAGLLVCLTCGWVACTTEPRQNHARAHYEETDHPIAEPLHSGTGPRWCFADERAV